MDAEVGSTWRVKLASKELCGRFQRCFGAFQRMIVFLKAQEQVLLQGLDHWTYYEGVPRAQTSIIFDIVFLFPKDQRIWQLSYPSSKVTVLDTEINSNGWWSVQVGKDIFQVQDGLSGCRQVINMGSSRLSVIQKAPIKAARFDASFCNVQNRFIFATGGMDGAYSMMSSVERYDLARDVWKEILQMNEARFYHGSCTLGSTVFVICGYGQKALLNNIEKLETLDLEAGWQLIQIPPTSLLTPRMFPVVAALNSREIPIMGGQYRDSNLSDVLIFDSKADSVTITTEKTPFAFKSMQVSCIQVGFAVVVALVSDTDETDHLVQYRNGSVNKLLQ